ncbi:MAG: S41 family peptidase [Thermoflavifilum sp.]|nr:S41 family peptidase [Thermoflavifilum sp.]
MLRRRFNGKWLWAVALGATIVFAIRAFRTDDRYFDIIKSLDIYASVFRNLNTYYVDSLSPMRLMQTSVDAMTSSLDPYTTFYPEQDVSDLTFQTTGKYGGTGIAIRRESNRVIIADVYQDSPAELAGIKPGDEIEAIDGKAADTLSTEAISNMLRGEAGTTVVIQLFRPYLHQHFTIKLVRAEINIRSVPYATRLPNRIGYICLQQFTPGCSEAVKKNLDSLKNLPGGLSGLILDLRNNPGGLLEEAVKTANLFLPPGQTVVSLRGRIKSWDQTFRTTARPDDDSIPLVILIDHQSASAAEILAGAMQDLDRAVIIGQRSYGKGLVQTTYDLPYDAKLKITSARYYTPSGRCIQAVQYTHDGPYAQLADVPDSLRHTFYTSHGRVVRDGGGIEPDIPLQRHIFSEIAEDLLSSHMIFDFATHYFYTHPQPSSPHGLHFTDTDYQDFLSFLKTHHYHFQSTASQLLDQLSDEIQRQGWWENLRAQTDSLRITLHELEEQQLLTQRKDIEVLLKAEIADRYWPQLGELITTLPIDPTIQKARDILIHSQQYQAILQPHGD